MDGDDQHPDLQQFYEELLAGDDEDFYPDEDDEDADDDDYDIYLDAEDIDEEIELEEDEDGNLILGEMEFDEEEDDEDENDDEELEEGEDGEGEEDEEEDDDDGSGQWMTIQELLSAAGRSGQSQASLLARLLAGSSGDREGLTRSGGWRVQSTPIDPAERARAAAQKRKRERWWEVQKEPHPRGLQLLRSGEFGYVGPWRNRRTRMLPPCKADIKYRAQATVPNSHGTVVASYNSIPYVGQYAGADYSLFYAATQNFTLHLYDTSQSKAIPPRPRPAPRSPNDSAGPPRMVQGGNGRDSTADYMEQLIAGGTWSAGRPREDTSMKQIKKAQGIEGRWTITDCDADKKAEKMIYSSITPYVHMLYTAEDDQEHIELDFSASRRGAGRGSYGMDHFGLWSIRFSADGKEVVAGASDGKIMVYDIEAQERSLSVAGHADDVNAVCFADESSTNILVSGSDDGYVKVWDRRSLSSSTPSGILVGATEGITYTSPKGDGRYIVANSKDQAARLYDLRKMRNHSEFETERDAVSRYGHPRYDYRNSRYPRPTLLAHPKDCSVMTYRGHAVLGTLIRCHFSPRENTGQNYIYSGSADGMIHIWSLDGRIVQVLNRAQTQPLRALNGGYNDPSAPEGASRLGRNPYATHENPYGSTSSWTVRDVSWHGYEPTLMSTCWEMDGGYRTGGTLAKHEWKGLGKGGLKYLEDWVEKQTEEARG